jgi:hypothetical protein
MADICLLPHWPWKRLGYKRARPLKDFFFVLLIAPTDSSPLLYELSIDPV